MTTCPGCGAELVVGLERTEEDRLREVVRSELAMQPPVVVHDTVEVPALVTEPDAADEDDVEDVEDAIDELADSVEDLAEQVEGEDASDEIADDLADELAALDEPDDEPAPTPAPDAEPSNRGHFLNRKVFG